MLTEGARKALVVEKTSLIERFFEEEPPNVEHVCPRAWLRLFGIKILDDLPIDRRKETD